MSKTSAFAKQFEPVDGGYVYFNSSREGGKFVSEEEFDRLNAEYARATGWRANVSIFLLLFVAVLAATLLSAFFDVPSAISTLLVAMAMVFIGLRATRAVLAPGRLVRGRPDHTPPRSRAEQKRKARSLIGWPMLIALIAISGLVFSVTVWEFEWSFASVAWLLGSGWFMLSSVGLVVAKFRDRADQR